MILCHCEGEACGNPSPAPSHCEGEARGNPSNTPGHCETSPQTGCGNPSPYDEFARARTEQSFFVPKQEIVDNEYDLSINKYKKTEYKPVEYPPTSEILQRLDDLEAEIQKELAELKLLLDEKN